MFTKSSTATIIFENVSKKYVLTQKNNIEGSNDFWALKNISFTLTEGDKLGIIGANGSGKTTLLKLLSQAIKPTTGRIALRGNIVSILDIGSGFHPDLSGRANVKLSGKMMLGMSNAEIEKRLPKIIEFSELNEFIDEPVKNYSNGMYLRLALSIALFCNLDILVLDEVFSVGDSSFRLKSYDKMNQIFKQAASIVLASHNVEDVLRVCNKCLWLEKGKIKLFGTPEKVFAAYMRAYQDSSNNHVNHLCHHQSWDLLNTPKTNDIKIHSVSLINETNPTAQNIAYSDKLSVSIAYTKLNPQEDIGFSIIVTDQMGVQLFTTSSYLTNLPVNINAIENVFLVCQCNLPSMIFNLGIYKVNICVLKDKTEPALLLNSVLVFKIETANPQQEEQLNTTPIKIVPTLHWTTTSHETPEQAS